MKIKEIYNLSINTFKSFVLEEDYEIINKALSSIEEEDFVDYNTWVWVKPLIALKARLNKDNNKIVENCKSKILTVLNQGKEFQVKINKRVFERSLKGEDVFSELINEYRKLGDIEMEIEILLKAIMNLVVVIEMGASSEFTVEMANKKLNILKERLKKLLKN